MEVRSKYESPLVLERIEIAESTFRKKEYLPDDLELGIQVGHQVMRPGIDKYEIILDITVADKDENIYVNVKEITGEARLKGKDLVIENLDFSGKKTDLQKNRDYNRMITQLAYGRYTQAVKRRCFKDNVDLKIVDPAYTSKKAKETVCRELGINVHLGAACMIARRGLGLF